MNEILGNHGPALDEYDRLIRITLSELPLTCAWALNGRAWIRATCSDPSFRNGDQAVADARRACQAMSWRDVNCIDTLAAAYAETGDFASAIRFEEQAISSVAKDEFVRLIKDHERRRNESERIVADLRRHQAAYERHQPWRSNRD
jgi:hypothetical protein